MWFAKKKYKEFVSSKDEKKTVEDSSPITLEDFLDGSLLTSSILKQQRPLILIVFFFFMALIAIRNYSEQLYKYKSNLNTEVKELRYESVSVSSGLMFISKQSEIKKRIDNDNLNLIESIEPPINILVEEGYECQ